MGPDAPGAPTGIGGNTSNISKGGGGGLSGLLGSLGSLFAGGGPAAALLSGGLAVMQMVNQEKQRKDAERAAERALDEARQKLAVNYYEALSVPTMAYERAFQNQM